MARAEAAKRGKPKGITNVSLLMAALWGLGFAVLTYVLVWFSLRDFNFIPIYSYLFERGTIPYVTTLCFWWAFFILYLKIPLIHEELRAFDEVEERVFRGTDLAKSTIGVETKIIDDALAALARISALPRDRKQARRPKRYMLVVRLENALRRLRNTRSTAEVDDVLRAQSEIDANIVESSYIPFRFFVALIPILGFLGTVFGIGLAISGFAGVLERAQSFDAIRPSLRDASYNLGVAFDTTLLALFYSGILLFFNSVIQKREEDLLAAVDEFCMEHLVSRVHILPADIAEIKDVVTSVGSDVLHEMQTQTRALEKAVQKAIAEGAAALAERMQPGRDGAGLAELNTNLESIVQILDENLEAIRKRVEALAKREAEPAEKLGQLVDALGEVARRMEALDTIGKSVQGMAKLSGVLEELQRTLDALRPAIDKMSAETAAEVNRILSKLLKAMVAAYKLERMTDQEIALLNDDRVMRRIFPD